MTVTIEKGVLIIKIPVEKELKPSSTGKTLCVASSHGNQKTTAMVNGRAVTVGLNAYVKND